MGPADLGLVEAYLDLVEADLDLVEADLDLVEADLDLVEAYLVVLDLVAINNRVQHFLNISLTTVYHIHHDGSHR